MSLPRFLRLSALASVLLGTAPVLAQTPPPPAQQGGKPAEPAKPPVQLDATGKALADKTDALAKEAQALVDAYKKALEERVDKLAAENPTLKRLNKAGLFTVKGLCAGVSADPLSGLRDIRGVYEDLDTTVQSYVSQFGGVAKQSVETQAIEYMRKVVKAESQFREDDKDGNGILDYCGTFAELGQFGLLDIPPIKKGDPFIVVEGYRFRIVTADTLTWAADAAPVRAEEGSVYLYTDQSGVIRAEKGKAAGPSSPPYKAPEPK